MRQLRRTSHCCTCSRKEFCFVECSRNQQQQPHHQQVANAIILVYFTFQQCPSRHRTLVAELVAVTEPTSATLKISNSYILYIHTSQLAVRMCAGICHICTNYFWSFHVFSILVFIFSNSSALRYVVAVAKYLVALLQVLTNVLSLINNTQHSHTSPIYVHTYMFLCMYTQSLFSFRFYTSWFCLHFCCCCCCVVGLFSTLAFILQLKCAFDPITKRNMLPLQACTANAYTYIYAYNILYTSTYECMSKYIALRSLTLRRTMCCTLQWTKAVGSRSHSLIHIHTYMSMPVCMSKYIRRTFCKILNLLV